MEKQEVKTSFDKYGDIIKTRKTEKGINILNFSALQRSLFNGFSRNLKKLEDENKNLKEEINKIKGILENHKLNELGED